ncbi:MAG: hypothetical protein ACYTF1_17265 [Planctomycetota bacterium]
MFSSVRKWLFLLGSGSCLLASGCPTSDEIKNVFADAVEDVASTIIASFISGIFGVGT